MKQTMILIEKEEYKALVEDSVFLKNLERYFKTTDKKYFEADEIKAITGIE